MTVTVAAVEPPVAAAQDSHHLRAASSPGARDAHGCACRRVGKPPSVQ
jgi:hypothetical protein